MIEIKSISKTYKTKKGLEVNALKNVSLNFPDKGMVFILGKSGSGKSTLLNVLGGLDSYDSGEFIIKGKSSKDFKQSDFDSYRNTLVGFIFQDYNILEEFSVGANIALALQLQGKKADSETVNAILDEVDLTGYGNRKPNELSGGQKQRVAIARALIKDPDIIMADEPTGALDSNTGRQVFDTLKKLSKEKLVIIVSHDREFAEYYGDRVIELKDGEVLSDITKYEAAAEVKSEGLKVIDNRIMQVKKGYKLTNKDLEMINSYLENSETDSYLSLDSRTNESLKQIAMISDDGGKQSFKDTDNAKIAENSNHNDYKIIRSRLPFKHSLRIGLSSCKAKPIRLIFTIILSMVAFGLFGVADTFASFNETTAMVSSLIDNKDKTVAIQKGGMYTADMMTDEYLADLNADTGIKAKGVWRGTGGNDGHFSIGNIYNTPDEMYYTSQITGFVEMSDAEFAERELKLVGRAAHNTSEIVITKYLLEVFQQVGYTNNETGVRTPADQITSEQVFLDIKPTLSLELKTFKIVGIVDTEFDKDNKYAALKEKNSGMNGNLYQLHEKLYQEVRRGYHALGFVHAGTLLEFAGNDIGYSAENSGSVTLDGYSFYKLAKFDNLKNSNIDFVTKSNITSLGENEIILDHENFYNYLSRAGASVSSDDYSYDISKEKFKNGDYDSYLTIDYAYSSYRGDEFISKEMKIVGLYDANDVVSWEPLIVDNSTFNSVFVDGVREGKYAMAIGQMPKTRAGVEKLVSWQETKDLGKALFILTDSTVALENFASMIKELAKIFIYIGIGFACFAALMLMNFIATSISYKKREIGILRAVGARGSDVFGIFCNESMFIALINFILAAVATFVACIGINSVVRNQLQLPITLLTVGIRQIALLLGVSVVTAFLASLLPVLKISRKRPIDAIRKK